MASSYIDVDKFCFLPKDTFLLQQQASSSRPQFDGGGGAGRKGVLDIEGEAAIQRHIRTLDTHTVAQRQLERQQQQHQQQYDHREFLLAATSSLSATAPSRGGDGGGSGFAPAALPIAVESDPMLDPSLEGVALGGVGGPTKEEGLLAPTVDATRACVDGPHSRQFPLAKSMIVGSVRKPLILPSGSRAPRCAFVPTASSAASASVASATARGRFGGVTGEEGGGDGALMAQSARTFAEVTGGLRLSAQTSVHAGRRGRRGDVAGSNSVIISPRRAVAAGSGGNSDPMATMMTASYNPIMLSGPVGGSVAPLVQSPASPLSSPRSDDCGNINTMRSLRGFHSGGGGAALGGRRPILAGRRAKARLAEGADGDGSRNANPAAAAVLWQAGHSRSLARLDGDAHQGQHDGDGGDYEDDDRGPLLLLREDDVIAHDVRRTFSPRRGKGEKAGLGGGGGAVKATKRGSTSTAMPPPSEVGDGANTDDDASSSNASVATNTPSMSTATNVNMNNCTATNMNVNGLSLLKGSASTSRRVTLSIQQHFDEVGDAEGGVCGSRSGSSSPKRGTFGAISHPHHRQSVVMSALSSLAMMGGSTAADGDGGAGGGCTNSEWLTKAALEALTAKAGNGTDDASNPLANSDGRGDPPPASQQGHGRGSGGGGNSPTTSRSHYSVSSSVRAIIQSAQGGPHEAEEAGGVDSAEEGVGGIVTAAAMSGSSSVVPIFVSSNPNSALRPVVVGGGGRNGAILLSEALEGGGNATNRRSVANSSVFNFRGGGSRGASRGSSRQSSPFGGTRPNTTATARSSSANGGGGGSSGRGAAVVTESFVDADGNIIVRAVGGDSFLRTPPVDTLTAIELSAVRDFKAVSAIAEGALGELGYVAEQRAFTGTYDRLPSRVTYASLHPLSLVKEVLPPMEVMGRLLHDNAKLQRVMVASHSDHRDPYGGGGADGGSPRRNRSAAKAHNASSQLVGSASGGAGGIGTNPLLASAAGALAGGSAVGGVGGGGGSAGPATVHDAFRPVGGAMPTEVTFSNGSEASRARFWELALAQRLAPPHHSTTGAATTVLAPSTIAVTNPNPSANTNACAAPTTAGIAGQQPSPACNAERGLGAAVTDGSPPSAGPQAPRLGSAVGSSRAAILRDEEALAALMASAAKEPSPVVGTVLVDTYHLDQARLQSPPRQHQGRGGRATAGSPHATTCSAAIMSSGSPTLTAKALVQGQWGRKALDVLVAERMAQRRGEGDGSESSSSSSTDGDAKGEEEDEESAGLTLATLLDAPPPRTTRIGRGRQQRLAAEDERVASVRARQLAHLERQVAVAIRHAQAQGDADGNNKRRSVYASGGGGLLGAQRKVSLSLATIAMGGASTASGASTYGAPVDEMIPLTLATQQQDSTSSNANAMATLLQMSAGDDATLFLQSNSSAAANVVRVPAPPSSSPAAAASFPNPSGGTASSNGHSGGGGGAMRRGHTVNGGKVNIFDTNDSEEAKFKAMAKAKVDLLLYQRGREEAEERARRDSTNISFDGGGGGGGEGAANANSRSAMLFVPTGEDTDSGRLYPTFPFVSAKERKTQRLLASIYAQKKGSADDNDSKGEDTDDALDGYGVEGYTARVSDRTRGVYHKQDHAKEASWLEVERRRKQREVDEAKLVLERSVLTRKLFMNRAAFDAQDDPKEDWRRWKRSAELVALAKAEGEGDLPDAAVRDRMALLWARAEARQVPNEKGGAHSSATRGEGGSHSVGSAN